jgi:hypothetical protein
LNDRLEEARAEFERLQKELESRRSVAHFARVGVSSLGALICAAAAAKLFYDSVRFPILGLLSAVLCVCLVTYATHHYRKGRRLLKRELEHFESLKALRRTLRIDDPFLQLPR